MTGTTRPTAARTATTGSPDAAPTQARSLKTRLLWTVLGSVGLVWLVVAVATWYDTRHELDELLDAHLSQAAALLVSQPLDGSSPTLLGLPERYKYQSSVVLQVWRRGQLVLRSATAPQQPLAAPGQQGLSTTRINAEAWRVFTTTGQGDEVVVHVAERQRLRSDVLRASLRSAIWPMLIALPLLGMAIWWAVRHAVQPLQALGDLVAQRPPGGLEPLPTQQVPQEALPMVTALNRLFDRTAALMDAERRFTADAAHELRTPMAAIRIHAQVAQGATNAAERAEALAATVQGCDRATHLMEQLLQLARLDSTEQAPAARCDLSASVASVVADLRPLAQRRGQHMAWEHAPGTPPLWVAMPPALATVLLRNLLDNALRYSPDGATVRLQTHAPADGEPGPVSVALHDSGPGLSAADRLRLGERFFRVLGSGQAGSGLGWSIAARIARLHGIDVAVGQSTELGGLHVTLTWPHTSPPTPPT